MFRNDMGCKQMASASYTIAFGLLASIAVVSVTTAQPATSGAGNVPKEVAQRTYYPKTDIYKPDELLGRWVFYNGTTLEFLSGSHIPSGTTPHIEFEPSNKVYSVNLAKGDDAKAGIPVFASVEVHDKEVQSLTIIDIARATINSGADVEFCKDWINIKNSRTWNVGDELRYIDGATLSHVAWKMGSEHQKGGELALGDYFSAGGKQYDQTSTSGLLPAIAIDTSYKSITAKDIAGTSCSGGASPRLAPDSRNGHVRLNAVSVAPLLQ